MHAPRITRKDTTTTKNKNSPSRVPLLKKTADSFIPAHHASFTISLFPRETFLFFFRLNPFGFCKFYNKAVRSDSDWGTFARSFHHNHNERWIFDKHIPFKAIWICDCTPEPDPTMKLVWGSILLYWRNLRRRTINWGFFKIGTVVEQFQHDRVVTPKPALIFELKTFNSKVTPQLPLGFDTCVLKQSSMHLMARL